MTGLGAALLLSCLLAGCSAKPAATQPGPVATSPGGASASPSAAAGATPVVLTIKDFAFSALGPVAAGQKIMVKNADGEAHSVTADAAGAFDVNVTPSSTMTLTAPSKPGTYKFHCKYHGNMRGSITVR